MNRVAALGKEYAEELRSRCEIRKPCRALRAGTRPRKAVGHSRSHCGSEADAGLQLGKEPIAKERAHGTGTETEQTGAREAVAVCLEIRFICPRCERVGTASRRREAVSAQSTRGLPSEIGYTVCRSAAETCGIIAARRRRWAMGAGRRSKRHAGAPQWGLGQLNGGTWDAGREGRGPYTRTVSRSDSNNTGPGAIIALKSCAFTYVCMFADDRM